MNIGDRHNRLVILDKFSIQNKKNRKGRKTPRTNTYYIAKCDCGNVLPKFRQERLTNKIGCKSCTITYNNNLKKGGKYLTINNYSSKRRIYKHYIKSAHNRSLNFDLTEDQVLTFLDGNCYYCGQEPSEGKNKDLGNTLHGPFLWNGIDRVDSKIGYEINNCVSCCSICNNAKTNLSKDEFLNWVGRIYNNLKERSSTIPHKGSTPK